MEQLVLTRLEDAVDVLMHGRAGDCGAGVSAHQTVDRRDDRRHFGPADDAVAVHVVQVERPAQLVVHTSTRDHRQTRHKVLDTPTTRTARIIGVASGVHWLHVQPPLQDGKNLGRDL